MHNAHLSPTTYRLIIRVGLSLLLLAVVLFLRTGTTLPSPTVTRATVSEWSAASAVRQVQARLQARPNDADSYALLGLALLQQVREDGDAANYLRAEEAFAAALARDPEQVNALVGQGLLALARHDFVTALTWGEQARGLNPYNVEALGVLVDGYVELGRYTEAIDAAQKMVDLRPGVASYTRVSYLRELHGDVDGAIHAMTRAVDAGVPGSEQALWSQVQLGHLYFNRGDWTNAESHYRATLAARPNYVYARAGLARVHAARGQHDDAIRIYAAVAEEMPLPEFLIPLGELYQRAGQPEKAAEQFDLVRVIARLQQAAGMDVDLEMALFEIEHGDNPASALAKARAAYTRRPSVHAANVLAWAFYHHGDYAEAQRYSNESLRLGTQDASFHYHAARIAHALNDDAAARHHVVQVNAINPGFSILYSAERLDTD
ncbi:tetratricopeptide repeat protein [bacterium]|nr:tetratricopeptide repeat protein [bacterium]